MMKLSSVFSLALAFVGSVSATVSISSLNKTASSVVSGRYIVEFDTSAHYQSAGLKRAASPHEAIYQQLDARDTSYTVHQEYSCSLFVGASLSLASDSDLVSLLSITGVVNIYPVHLLSLPSVQVPVKGDKSKSPSPTTASTTTSTKVTTTTSCTGKKNKQTCTTQTVTVTASATSTASATPFSANWQIQADKVQATGNKGKGIKIGVIDSGVDYTRTPLGGGYGSGYKIAGGYDFVGDDFTGSNDPVPDSDPYDDCYGHGTFVAGIIGANANEYGVTGVAPEATQYAYRVFSCSGATTDDIVLMAMQRAYNDDMDIINLSFGESSAWTESMLSVYASRLVASGTVIVSSAGNQGQVGAFYSYSPSAGLGVINVGSVDNAVYPAQLATVSTGYGPIPYYNFEAVSTGTYSLYAFSTDPAVTFDGCTVPSPAPDLSGKVVIVRRGGCGIVTKAQVAASLNATAIFVVNYQGYAPIYEILGYINFAFISYEDGNYLLDQIAANANITLSFSFNPVAQPNIWTGNTTSYFSEIGPTNDLYMAPTVLAPGMNLVGVIPAALGNWSIADGTSFASPFAAGAAALYLNAKGTNNVSPKDLQVAFENTADQLAVSVSDGSLESVAAQGSGKLQISDAITPGVIVSPSELLLNDTAYFAGVQYLTIKNTGSSKATFKLSNVAAGTALAYQSGSNQSNDEPVPQVSNAASVKILPSSLTLPAGTTGVAVLSFTAPNGLDAKQFPIYSGWIQVTGGPTTVQVPYLGVAAKMKNMPIIDPTSYYFGINTPTILNPSGDVQSGTESYSFVDSDYPSALYRLVGGTPLLLIDLVSANASLGFTPQYTSRKRSETGSLDATLASMRRAHTQSLEARRIKSTGYTSTSSINTLWCQLTNYKGIGCAGSNSGTGSTFAKVPIIGNVYEADYIPRNTDNIDGAGGDYEQFSFSTPTFTNGTTVPNGSYRFLMRALHITGDRTKESDYEAWLSAPFTVAQ